MTPYDNKIFGVAKAAAKTSTHNRAHIGAVLVSHREIIGIGVNGKKSHPLQRHYNKFRFADDTANHLMHAEVDALVKARHLIRNDTAIYIYREMKDDTHGMSRPCAGCMRALVDFNVKNVFYTTDRGLAYEQLR